MTSSIQVQSLPSQKSCHKNSGLLHLRSSHPHTRPFLSCASRRVIRFLTSTHCTPASKELNTNTTATSDSTSTMEHPFLKRHQRVLLYVPNLIGYARIALTLGALACAAHYPLLCVAIYFLAFVCDELDGRAARTFNQTSTLGAVLDMVTDRVATTGLLALLCGTYPDFHIVFIALIALDIFSHWFQMYSTLLAGSSTHKDVNSRSALVRLYYSNRIFMGFCCICCEVMYLALFLLHVPEYRQICVLDMQLPQPLLQALEGSPLQLQQIADSWQCLPGLALIALLALPGVVVKQVCNWVQLRAAVLGLVEHDVKRMA